MTKEKDISKMETTTLTERWKNNDLPPAYYYIRDTPNDVIDIAVYDFDGYFVNLYMERYTSYAHKKLEILAPVPSCEQFVELTEKANQFSQMVKKVEGLEKQLKEANNLLLGFLDENICSFDHNRYCQEHSSTEPNYRCIQQQLKWYFKKYEVLK